MSADTRESYPEIREAIAKLCARYRAECRCELDRRMAYSREFVNIAKMLTANASSEAPNVCI
jgi:hypothetical protein